ncbi:winged helix-turn-helix domain-containing protein [Microbacterium oleivorans]|uniref:winged helix-turn-helix domain-containing protein n=1 Tax=Microbacterium oleivorans TaxID=273677 RepID=UPI0034036DDC
MIAVPAVVGSTRVIVLADESTIVRGSQAEFRHFGVCLVLRTDVIRALAELVHDPDAVIVVPAALTGCDLEDVIDLARAADPRAVLLGVPTDMDPATVAHASMAGPNATVPLPLTPERLATHLRAVLGLLPPRHAGIIQVGDLTVDADRFRVEWRGAFVETTPREFDILLTLALAHPRMITLAELASRYGTGTDRYASVRTAVGKLRRRFAEVSGEGRDAVLLTQHGVGYRFAA